MPKLLTVIIPCYNEEENVLPLADASMMNSVRMMHIF